MSDTFSFAQEYESFGDDLVPKAYPAGTYKLRVKKADAVTTSGGKQAFKLTLEIMTGPHKGKTVAEQMTWSPENQIAAQIFARGMSVLGAPMEWIRKTNPTPEQIANRILGSVVEANLKEDEFNGQPRNRVNFTKTIKTKAEAKDEDGELELGAEAPSTKKAKTDDAAADDETDWDL